MKPPWKKRDNPPYVIAEIGVNHDGSVERALELVDSAAGAGADAIKLQLFETDMLMSKVAQLTAYQKAAGETDPFAMLRRLELSVDELAPIVERAHERQLDAIVTVFSVDLVPVAEQLPWDAYKTASPDIIHKPLLCALHATGKPIILSTGAATIEEVIRASNWFADASDRIAFLQCVSSYPTPIDKASLGGIIALNHALRSTVGYSDHTVGCEAGAWAVELGAKILEKHLTYDRSAAGPDHRASLGPDQFAQYVKLARAAVLAPVSKASSTPTPPPPDSAVGPFSKRVSKIEQNVRVASRQSLVASHDLQPGERLKTSDLTFKRPGVGIEPCRMIEAIGLIIVRPIEANMPIVEEDLA